METLKIQLNGINVIGTRYDESNAEDGWLVVSDYPQELIFDPFNWYYIEGEFVKEDPEVTRQREKKERFYAEMNDTSNEHKLKLLVESIPVLEKPADRDGYLWVQMYNADGNCFGWREVEDPYYEPTHKGTYTDPKIYNLGDVVTKYTDPDPFTGDGWYTYDGDVKVCIKSGVPTSFEDEEYFSYSV